MIDALRDIRAKLSQGAYSNEEHVRLNVVARILQEAGWNIWDPREVNAEWPVAPSEDATRVDLALFLNSYVPSVFIEIKAVGKVAGNLSAVEKQVRDYNRNNTALFSVITDGQEWRVYYSQTGGEFAQKCLKVVDLVRDDLSEVERMLTTLLSKAEIEIGNAKAEAEKYLQLNQRQRAMEDSLPVARRQVLEPPYPSLPDCLAALVGQRGITITPEEAKAYVSTAAGGRLPAASPVTEADDVPETDRELPPDNLGDLKFSRVLEGALGSASATHWSELVAAGVRLALARGIGLQDLRAKLAANLREGNFGDKGFALIAGTNVSIQCMDANKAARNLLILARLLGCPLLVRILWSEGSPFAGRVGLLEWRPSSPRGRATA